jgi:membrane protein DedA with SNARE-associated domain
MRTAIKIILFCSIITAAYIAGCQTGYNAGHLDGYNQAHAWWLDKKATKMDTDKTTTIKI